MTVICCDISTLNLLFLNLIIMKTVSHWHIKPCYCNMMSCLLHCIGRQGPDGNRGSTGRAGPSGSPGGPGPRGPSGPDGTSGATGKNSFIIFSII